MMSMESSGDMDSIFPVLAAGVVVFFWAAFLFLLSTALDCCRKTRIRLLAEKGDKKYQAALKLAEKPEFYRSSLGAGIVFLEILLGCLGGILLLKIFGPGRELFSLAGLVSFLIFVLLNEGLFFIFAQTVPGEIARRAPEKITAFFAPFITILSALSFPLNIIGMGLSSLIRRLLPNHDSSPGMTEDEFRIALLEGEKSGIVESKERTMVEGVFYLGDRPVGTFMTHRPDIQWLDINANPEKVQEIMESAGEQRYFPVASGDLDEVCGIVSVENILQALLRGSWPGLKTLMKPPGIVPETMPALKSFEAFKKSETSCLLVMDEYGGFAGMLTVQNLIEEIVGQLSAKAGEEDEIILQEDGVWLADGSLNIDSAAQALSLPSLNNEGTYSEYHTLAGFILNLAGEIPRTGAHFDYHGFRFTVVDLDGNRIDKIMITKIQSETTTPD